jgi:hypothetical protein
MNHSVYLVLPQSVLNLCCVADIAFYEGEGLAKNGFKAIDNRGLAVAKVIVQHDGMAHLSQNRCGVGPDIARTASEKDSLVLQLESGFYVQLRRYSQQAK